MNSRGLSTRYGRTPVVECHQFHEANLACKPTIAPDSLHSGETPAVRGSTASLLSARFLLRENERELVLRFNISTILLDHFTRCL